MERAAAQRSETDEAVSQRIGACRCCGGAELEPVLDLGLMPLSDRLVPEDRTDEPEPRFPLELVVCPVCSLAQITETVSPELLFRDDYPYYSSNTDALLRHSRDNAQALIRDRGLGPSSFVVELASNDGYMLRNFVERGVPALGVDPAQGPAQAAQAAGVPTLCEFFTVELAERLARERGPADVVIANNVLAHAADTNGFVRGIATILKDSGTTSIEAPYVRDLVERCEFDTIYHEHLCYFSVTAAKQLFERNGLFLNRVVRLPIHGGSLRLHAGRRREPDGSVEALLDEERRLGVDSVEHYRGLAERAARVRDRLREIVFDLRGRDKRVAAYGAAAKGAILLNYCALDADVIDFVVDRNPHKHGNRMSGVRVPILPTESLRQRMPDYALLLPWNFKEEILEQQSDYRRQGGRFIIPIPEPEIV